MKNILLSVLFGLAVSTAAVGQEMRPSGFDEDGTPLGVAIFALPKDPIARITITGELLGPADSYSLWFGKYSGILATHDVPFSGNGQIEVFDTCLTLLPNGKTEIEMNFEGGLVLPAYIRFGSVVSKGNSQLSIDTVPEKIPGSLSIYVAGDRTWQALDGSWAIDVQTVQQVPEPSTVMLLSMAALGFGLLWKRGRFR